MRLNPAQRAAVEHLHGPVLVVAGAGTGKTRVITERVRYLLETLPDLRGENLLAITYTQKAAAEMKNRIRRSTDKGAEGVKVSTFHAFCYELLHKHGQVRQILDDVDYWIFLRRRLDRLGLDLFKKLSEPGRFLKDFRTFFSRCQDELVGPEEYAAYVGQLEADQAREKHLLAEDERAEREQELRRQQEVARAYARAERLLAEANCTTFGGSLLSAVQLLQSNPDVLAHYQDRLRYLLVDEFQDANIAQITLLHLLAARHRNVTVVGDDDQAIYRFRGASYASFRKFRELFPDCRHITLTENYRSTARLLRVATELIAQNAQARFDPHKKLKAAHPEGEKVRLAEAEDKSAEAATVIREIQRLHRATKTYSDIAVLYRARVHRTALVKALMRARIPFVIRHLSLLDHPRARDLLAYLRVIESLGDNVGLVRLLALPAWGVRPEWLLELTQTAHRKNQTVWDAIQNMHPDVRDRQTRLGDLLRLLAELGAASRRLPVTQLFGQLLDRIGLRPLPSDPDALVLRTFADFLAQWEQEKSETKQLSEFIEYFNYFEEAGGSLDFPEDTDARDAVQLMTIHAAKGLEFDSVFVLRLNRNDFPVRRQRPLFVFPEALMKEALPPGDTHVPEERRLCYVAMTRARRRLLLTTLTGARTAPSIFLEDIQRDPRVAQYVERVPAAALVELPANDPGDAGSDPAPLFPPPQGTLTCSQIAQWARDLAAPEPAEPLHLNHSKIETYLRCPLKYKLAEEWKVPVPQTPPIVFGHIMHRTLVEFFRARQRNPALPLDEVRHIYEQQWRQTAWPFNDAYQQREYFSSGWEQLETFYRQAKERPAEVYLLEKNFKWPFEDVILTGRIDQINRLKGKAVEIVEYKTGQPRPQRAERSLQLALYALAVEDQLQLVPERLTLYHLTVNEPISFASSDHQRQQAQQQIRDVAARIRAREFPANSGYHCRYCEYRRICPEHEQPLTLSRLHSPATPEPVDRKN